MGSAIECFESAGAVVVPRTRFAPVKTCNDLFVLRSDAYRVRRLRCSHRVGRVYRVEGSRSRLQQSVRTATAGLGGGCPMAERAGRHTGSLVALEARSTSSGPRLTERGFSPHLHRAWGAGSLQLRAGDAGW